MIVHLFLKQKLNNQIAKEYLQLYDEFYHQAIAKYGGSQSKEKVISRNSVRVCKICNHINKELTHGQKVVLLISLWEFVKADGPIISQQENEYIKMVADTFYLSEKVSMSLQDFVVSDFDKIHGHSEMLFITGETFKEDVFALQQLWEGLDGTIKMLQIVSVNLYIFRYVGKNELYLNGQVIRKDACTILTPGNTIRDSKIAPIYYSEIINAFRTDKSADEIVLKAKDISYNFPGSQTGIQSMNFEARTGRLIGVIGASGSGKSTLLNILNGNFKPETGSVSINDIDIKTVKDSYGIIGYVSQDDFLFDDLSVFQNLYYNARLCFKDMSDTEITDLCHETLKSLGLEEVSQMKVGSPLDKKISGGQRKRLNIAMELIRKPNILFLDEPTSGLSSRDSEIIMDLLKELSFKGKLVITVIHQPSSSIFKLFDSLYVLDKGGYLIYHGNPVDSLIYFKSHILQADWNESECKLCGNVNAEKIFDIVEANVIDEFGRPSGDRKISAWEWNQYFLSHEKHQKTEPSKAKKLPEASLNKPGWFRQFWVFVTRDFLSKISRKQYLIINLLETPLLALLLTYILKYSLIDESGGKHYMFSENSNLPVYLFMAVIVAIFVGLSVSSEEIIKDRAILKRESFLNLSWSSYLGSKIFILFILSAIQSFTFVAIANTVLEIQGMLFSHWLVLFTTWCSAILTGLMISDSFKTTVNVYILIPFLIIPQIILGGALVKYDKMNPSVSSHDNVPLFGELIVARWGFEALVVNQYLNNDFEKGLFYYDKAMSKANYKKNFWVPALQNKMAMLTEIDQTKGSSAKSDSLFILIRNELERESTNNSRLRFVHSSSMKDKAYFKSEAGKYLESLWFFYDRLYKLASSKRDSFINSLQVTPEATKAFRKLKNDQYNEALADMVRNTIDPVKIISSGQELIQKADPIFRLPDKGSFRSHFYAPKKYAFGTYWDTYWINLWVIWLMSLGLCVAIYFRWLKQIMQFGSRLRRWGRKAR
ncbi:MAG: ATP-binding cassette domain-containing protein [Bacteroidales bacterium]|nr:ATP-binding cassette domain-containing protein [Bacteroidales bacterium]MCF8456202.1 ATP-binding cassette domain-containing protein [Bacteroidales bacterium]